MVIAAMMPLLVKLGRQSPIAKGLILGIPIAATTGGMGTIIGSPPNAVAVGALVNAGQTMDFITWMYRRIRGAMAGPSSRRERCQDD